MSSQNGHVAEEVLNQKRVPKGPIKFNVTLNEEQKEAKAKILNSDITVLLGKAGSGKTLLACQTALDCLFKKEVDKIIISRPTVSKEEFGFLPGNIKSKMDPWLGPIYLNLYAAYKKELIDKYITDGIIQILPFAFMQGYTFLNAFTIVDEVQNITDAQMEMVAGRLGKDSKMVMCGDIAQIHLRSKKDSGLYFFKELAENIPGLSIVELKTNHRHPIVEPILEAYVKRGEK